MFKTIFTEYGRAAITAANANNVPLNLSEMAVGDGGGAAVEPDEGQEELVNEVYRAAISAMYVDPDDANTLIAELVIPADEGSFTVREIGLYDEDGGLVAVANTPEVYKPVADDGAFGDCAFRMLLKLSDSASVTLENSGALLGGVVKKSGDRMNGKLGVVSVDATVSALGNVSGAKAIDANAASTFSMTIVGNTTLSFTNAPAAGRDQVIYLKITNGGSYSVTWPAGALFTQGEAPTLTATGKDLVGVWYDAAASVWVVGVIFADYK